MLSLYTAISSFAFTVTMDNPSQISSAVIIRIVCPSSKEMNLTVIPKELQIVPNVCEGENKVLGFFPTRTTDDKRCLTNGKDQSVDISYCK